MRHPRRIDLVPLRPSEPTPAVKGRGSAWAIEHRFNALRHDAEDDGWGRENPAVDERPLAPQAPVTQVIEETARSVLSANESPDIHFDLSVNPYRGCEHGCIYCFARPTHSYLNLSPGIDFETRIVAKTNVAERLRAALASRRYVPRLLNIGSATDAYQPVERRLRLTRGVIEVLHACRHPFSLVTKSAGVERDLDLLRDMAAWRAVGIYVSLTTLDPALARQMEPRAAAPHRRLQTIATLAEAGVPVGVSLSPMIPFLNEPELERLLEAAARAGAGRAFMGVLRLPWEVNPLFQDWLARHHPERAARVMARVRELHGGQDYDARFGQRQRGRGVWAELLRQRFDKACARLGLRQERTPLDFSQFRPPPPVPPGARPSGGPAAPDEADGPVAPAPAPAARQRSLF
ncbi:PA0069 family radical SAM protein [Piscinibacter sakaiensis]|nr:PA0069 family radical SAM protein [Piscinibacter sakaiensis]